MNTKIEKKFMKIKILEAQDLNKVKKNIKIIE